jgi:hypothetical protein
MSVALAPGATARDFELGDLRTERGEVLSHARLRYRILGDVDAAQEKQLDPGVPRPHEQRQRGGVVGTAAGAMKSTARAAPSVLVCRFEAAEADICGITTRQIARTVNELTT